MSYTPTNWQDGDVITAAKLNNMESGISNSGYDLVFMTSTIYLADVTDSNITLESGTFADAWAKALRGDKLSIRFYGYDTGEGGYIGTCDYDVQCVYADINYNDFIRFVATGGYNANYTPVNKCYASNTSGGTNTKQIFVYTGSPVRVDLSESGISVERF